MQFAQVTTTHRLFKRNSYEFVEISWQRRHSIKSNNCDIAQKFLAPYYHQTILIIHQSNRLFPKTTISCSKDGHDKLKSRIDSKRQLKKDFKWI